MLTKTDYIIQAFDANILVALFFVFWFFFMSPNECLTDEALVIKYYPIKLILNLTDKMRRSEQC